MDLFCGMVDQLLSTGRYELQKEKCCWLEFWFSFVEFAGTFALLFVQCNLIILRSLKSISNFILFFRLVCILFLILRWLMENIGPVSNFLTWNFKFRFFKWNIGKLNFFHLKSTVGKWHGFENPKFTSKLLKILLKKLKYWKLLTGLFLNNQNGRFLEI